ncbi:hypothetical protein ASPFODRAFT_368862 [Aspergillus luchuensis CBS 106.47]|uniref:Uncharacterized protein n=1 Tax=Aspergillus luchuensis (strain CBS 106.47) TaxID=1137211 RepID=A0A1M3T5H6_ASPLC|nr:hypothetical protein ASPFODRAFT_368862 [Aspergillus luchuensis CBS 106.47]
MYVIIRFIRSFSRELESNLRDRCNAFYTTGQATTISMQYRSCSCWWTDTSSLGNTYIISFFSLTIGHSTIEFVIVLLIRGTGLSLFGHDYSTPIMLIYKATWKQQLEIYKMLVQHPSIRTAMHSNVNYFHTNAENEQ